MISACSSIFQPFRRNLYDVTYKQQIIYLLTKISIWRGTFLCKFHLRTYRIKGKYWWYENMSRVNGMAQRLNACLACSRLSFPVCLSKKEGLSLVLLNGLIPEINNNLIVTVWTISGLQRLLCHWFGQWDSSGKWYIRWSFFSETGVLTSSPSLSCFLAMMWTVCFPCASPTYQRQSSQLWLELLSNTQINLSPF